MKSIKAYLQIKKNLKKLKPFLKEKFKVKKIGIFGSYVYNQETKKSDIDILVEFYEPIGWEFFDLKDYLEKSLNKKVDLVTKKALKPEIKNKILSDVIYA